MPRRTVIAVGGWVIAALLATFTGVAAVRVIGDGITAPVGRPLTQEQISQALASQPPSAPPATTDPVPSRSAAVASTPAGELRAIRTAAGTVVARCHGDQVTLQSWAPDQGYAVREAEPGPDEDAEVTFEGADDELEVTVVCVDGLPSATSEPG